MKKRLGLILIMLFLTSLVFAEMSISEPLGTYNLKDKLYVTVSGVRGEESGNFNIDLVCSNKTINLAKVSARSFPTEKDSVYELPFKILDEEDLEIENITDIIGNCQIIAYIGQNAVSTKVFTITDKIFITPTLDKKSYNPKEAITLKVDAVKANGDLFNGFIEVTEASFFSKAVESGQMMNTFSLSETLEAGTYYLNITAYDLGSKGRLNTGSSRISFDINQVATSLVLTLSDNVATPGGEFTISAEVFDQSGKEMSGKVSGKLISPSGEEREVLMNTKDYFKVNFPTNATAGIWKLRVFFEKLGEEREIEMKELQKVNLEIEGSVLIVTNVGNARYNKTISVQIGNETKELNLNMEMGEQRKFNLGAPEGEYEVLVEDGESSLSKQVLLTGRAISIDDLEKGSFRNYLVLWVFLIVLFGGVGIVMLRKSQKTTNLNEKNNHEEKNFLSKILDKFRGSGKRKSVEDIVYEKSKSDKKTLDLTSGKTSGAESALVLKGEKYPSAIISLSIKNYGTLGTQAKESLVKLIGDLDTKRGLVDWKSDYIFIIFSPVVTKTYANEVLASKVAFALWGALCEYNKRSKEKIEFNMGVNSGDIIASKNQGKLEYTGVGNTISLAKRISDSDSGKILVSENIRKRGIRDLSVRKLKEIGENPVYEVYNIKDREANEAKLKDLLKRGNI
ncbi:MAG: adenylate/guanylate cyclase domain-containing protein [Candidatus Pacearchaeota archaeon]